MKIGDIMNLNIHQITIGASCSEAARLFSTSQASDLMVVDKNDAFVGVLSEGDLIRKALPDFKELLEQGENLSTGIDLFIDKGREIAGDTIDDLVIMAPITMEPNVPIIKAATTMTAKQIRRLPVVSDGKLVGVISRSDICWGLLNLNASS